MVSMATIEKSHIGAIHNATATYQLSLHNGAFEKEVAMSAEECKCLTVVRAMKDSATWVCMRCDKPFQPYESSAAEKILSVRAFIDRLAADRSYAGDIVDDLRRILG
jgi:hypothetical protein